MFWVKFTWSSKGVKISESGDVRNASGGEFKTHGHIYSIVLTVKYKFIIIQILYDQCTYMYPSIKMLKALVLFIITLALAPATLWRTVHLKEYIPARYPFTTPGSRETIVDKMPCLRAYAQSGIRTHYPLITSRKHEPLHHSAPTHFKIICKLHV